MAENQAKQTNLSKKVRTEMTGDPLIPISAFTPPRGNNQPGEIEAVVIETITELEEAGQLVGKYKAIAVALRATARAVDEGLSFAGKTSVATAQLTQRLFDSLDKLPEPQRDTGSAFDTLEATITELTREAISA